MVSLIASIIGWSIAFVLFITACCLKVSGTISRIEEETLNNNKGE
jgi:RNase P/RNase MRP subunit POP5